MAFIHDDFLLDTELARRLYHNHAKSQPIIDYHCHLILKKSPATSSLRICQRSGWQATIQMARYAHNGRQRTFLYR